MGIVNAEVLRFLDLPDFNCTFRTLVQQLDEFPVDLVNFAPPIFDSHLLSIGPTGQATVDTAFGLFDGIWPVPLRLRPFAAPEPARECGYLADEYRIPNVFFNFFHN